MQPLIVLAAVLTSSAHAATSILSGEAAKSVVTQQCSRAEPEGVTGYWIPSKKEVQTVDEKFNECVKIKNAIDLSTRDRQYVGILKNSEKYIYVAVQGRSGHDLSKAIGICDGGPGYFGFEYNLAKESFENFAFDGRGSGPDGYVGKKFSCKNK